MRKISYNWLRSVLIRHLDGAYSEPKYEIQTADEIIFDLMQIGALKTEIIDFDANFQSEQTERYESLFNGIIGHGQN